MKIVNGIMAQLPYTPPRTQLCIVELEDSIATSRTPSEQKIYMADEAAKVNPFDPQEAETITGSGEWPAETTTNI